MEEIIRRVQEAVALGATEVCMQAGLPPDMRGDFYIELTRAVKRAVPEGAKLASEIMELASAIAKITGRPVSCVHVEYAPAARGRLGFGGQLVE